MRITESVSSPQTPTLKGAPASPEGINDNESIKRREREAILNAFNKPILTSPPSPILTPAEQQLKERRQLICSQIYKLMRSIHTPSDRALSHEELKQVFDELQIPYQENLFDPENRDELENKTMEFLRSITHEQIAKILYLRGFLENEVEMAFDDLKPLQSEIIPLPSKGMGCENSDQRCYAISAIQLLRMLVSKDISLLGSETVVGREVKKLLKTLSDQTVRDKDVEKFIQICHGQGWVPDEGELHNQQDAIEFLRWLLDHMKIHPECAKIEKSTTVDANQINQMEKASFFECYLPDSKKVDQMLIILKEYQEKNGVLSEEAIRELRQEASTVFAPIVFEMALNQFLHKDIKKDFISPSFLLKASLYSQQTASNYSQGVLASSPPFLIQTLGRISYESSIVDRDWDYKTTFNADPLELDEKFVPQCLENTGRCYKPAALLVHIRNSKVEVHESNAIGHYCVMMQTNTGTWYLYNDNQVEKCDLIDFQSDELTISLIVWRLSEEVEQFNNEKVSGFILDGFLVESANEIEPTDLPPENTDGVDPNVLQVLDGAVYEDIEQAVDGLLDLNVSTSINNKEICEEIGTQLYFALSGESDNFIDLLSDIKLNFDVQEMLNRSYLDQELDVKLYPLQKAILTQNPDIVYYCLSHGAKLDNNSEIGDAWGAFKTIAQEYTFEKRPSKEQGERINRILKMLIDPEYLKHYTPGNKRKAENSLIEHSGNSLAKLHQALANIDREPSKWHGSLNAVPDLVKQGANVHEKVDGISALEWAFLIQKGCPFWEILKVLKKSSRKEFNNALYFAMDVYNKSKLDYILDNYIKFCNDIKESVLLISYVAQEIEKDKSESQ